MKRFRVRLAGFGLAVLAGSAVGAEGEWHPAGAPPGGVVPAGWAITRFPADGPPGLPDAAEAPIWLPATGGPKPPPAAPAPPAPLPPIPLVPDSSPAPAGKPGLLPPPAPLPAVPPIPPATELHGPRRVIPAPPPTPAAQQPPVMPIPTPPGNVLPQPKPMTPPATPGTVRPATPLPGTPEPGDLPVAPAELMVPEGAYAPGKHGTFGSMPIRLSRDYAGLADLHGGSVRERAGLRRAGAGAAAAEPFAEQGYVQAEYLMWWATPLNIPILATTSTTGGFGFLGEPGTVPILGPGEFIGPFRQGFRTRAGWWIDGTGCALDGSFFMLPTKTASVVLTSDQYGIITRPVFSPNLQNGVVIGETGEAVAVPGILTGSLSAQASSVIWGFDANIRKCLCRTCDSLSTWFGGFRNINLQESLTITENINVIGVGGDRVMFNDPIGSVVKVQDRFATQNSFYGGQLGVTRGRDWGRLSFDGRASVALGVTHQELKIDGYQVRTQPGLPPMTFRGGLLAAGPNLGTFTRDEFSVVPELTLNMGLRATQNLKFYVGYNLIYWSNVIRPGDQIDTVVDLSFVPNSLNVPPSGQNRPKPLFRQSDMWIQGIQFGVEGRW